MNSLITLISNLSPDDKKKFLNLLKRRNKRSDVKNIALFNLLSNNKTFTNIDRLLYGKPSKGAYHALSKRLYDSLIDFVAVKSFEEESTIEMNCFKLVLASQIFFKQHENKAAFKTLAKAEKLAKKFSLYSILNDVYHIQIMNAHLDETIGLKKIVSKYEKNKRNLQQEENLAIFFATVQEELSYKNKQVSDIIYKNLEKFNISIEKSLTYQSLYKILQICNNVANITRDYYAIYEFIESACSAINTSERIKSKHLYEHIQILYYLANTNFRIRELNKAQNNLNEMRLYMDLDKHKYLNNFILQFTLLKNLTLIYSGYNDNAVKNLEHFNFQDHYAQKEYIHDLKLTYATALFLQENFKEALRVYQKFYRSDKWYSTNVGIIWVIKKNLLEILILIELNQFDLIESRLSSFKKKHRSHLIKHDEIRVLDFLKFVTHYYYNKESIQASDFKQKIEDSLNIKNNIEDIFVLSFYAWLMAKINGTTTYQTCLNYIL